ncbi:hypothetical protein GDO78_012979 [Eleutherodactylus coqui]|uniref:Uncharacterized protein n=1 Tax=Eleutherodactylus coqui TaxID=57060 RepID=A0A8J6EZE1_ELECQ|nr:hypothetical protein GDO78_012979 [Eleutherodactylus coqui]
MQPFPVFTIYIKYYSQSFNVQSVQRKVYIVHGCEHHISNEPRREDASGGHLSYNKMSPYETHGVTYGAEGNCASTYAGNDGICMKVSSGINVKV